MMWGVIVTSLIVLVIVFLIFLYLKIEELKRDESIRRVQDQIDGLRMELNQALQNTTGNISLRLDRTHEIFSQVSEKLGGLTEATKRVIELGEDIKKLEDLLKPPKIRGTLGEVLLQNLLAQVLPKESYEIQYALAGGTRVDAVIKIGDKIVPIDAKFPLDSFNKMMSAENEEKYKEYRREFIESIKKRINETARYILPDKGTFDFALMYIPAESVYYEAVVKDQEIFNYFINKKVIPVSPNTFYAYLITILYGLRSLKIEEKAREVISVLQRIEKDIEEMRKLFDRARNQLRNSSENLDEVDKKINEIIRTIASLK
ncbi:MAG: DNA recombination protein RmuC [Candidatus Hydrothermales bacterium]